jgi:hypothetical protein
VYGGRAADGHELPKERGGDPVRPGKGLPERLGKSYLLGNAMMRVCGWFDEKVDERTNFGDFWESGV